MHLKIKGIGFIMESKDKGPFLEFFEQMADLLQTSNFKTSLNRHSENQIGGTYKTLLSYMDTERDKSAMKYILSKITSMKFASKLQNTSNKESIRRSRDITPGNLRRFSELRQDVRKELGKRNLTKRQKCYFMKRLVEAERIKQIIIRNSERTGRKLKAEEFPDLVAIMEYEFGEGDHRERGGGGLESHSKLRNELLYRASDSKTKMKDEPKIYCIDSRDAKQVIRANTGHGGPTWRNIKNPDHTFDTSRTNAITPMTHLLVKTIETNRIVTLNKNPKVQELFLSPSPRSDAIVHIKRTGKAITSFPL